MPRVLVTGAGGYLGCVLVPLLLKSGWSVTAVDRFFFGRHRLPEHPHLDAVTLDVRALEARHLEACEAIVDLAAISNDPSGERFAQATLAINHLARARCAGLAASAGVPRYVLVSSCSLYGFRPPDQVCDEGSAIAPITTYARANAAAEIDILPLANVRFTPVALRLATLFGPSPRMRFDLAVNGMTWGAWNDRTLPLMRDGTQWRPFLHVADAAAAIRFVLGQPRDVVAGRMFDVVGDNVQLSELASRVAAMIGGTVPITWYGDPDRRSYRVSGARLAALGFVPDRSIDDGVAEIVADLAAGRLDRTSDTLTLGWYEKLAGERADLFAVPAT